MNYGASARTCRISHAIRLGLIVLLATSASYASPGYNAGDILVALTNGTVQVRAADGTLQSTITGPISAPAKGLAFDAQNNLYVTYWWNADKSSGNVLTRFRPDGSFDGIFGPGYDCNPSGIAIDSKGFIYVGEADCNGNIGNLDPSGNPIAAFHVAIEVGGPRWIDLASGDCIMYYTSAGQYVHRYDVCASTQLANFNTSSLSSTSQALGLRLLPDGGLIVADQDAVLRLDASGEVVARYNAPGESGFAGIFLADAAHSFWATSYSTGNVYKFDIASGQIVMSFNIGVSDTGAKGIVIVPQLSPPPPPAPPPPPPPPPPVTNLVGPPTDKDQCKNGGWANFSTPRTFRNQGDCIQFVETGK
jgi:outer membrane protein assembly factor BamB